jgi:hypothetical protein
VQIFIFLQTPVGSRPHHRGTTAMNAAWAKLPASALRIAILFAPHTESIVAGRGVIICKKAATS